MMDGRNKMLSVLIDTNILIPLEDSSREVPTDLSEMYRTATIVGCKILIHPAQKDDIERDSNESRKRIVLSKVNKYLSISNPPQLSDEELLKLGWRQNKENDRIDNLLLYSVLRGAVHLLVTNDEGIHKKAKRAGIQDSIYRSDQFLSYIKKSISGGSELPVGIQNRNLYEFNVNQPFFDSLRDGYSGFDSWYKSKAAEGRKAWCFHDNGIVMAMCIYKEENHPIVVDNGIPLSGKALKLCTFKVGERMRGQKIGERLLYCAFKYAIENRFDYVYLHTYGMEQKLLVSLCEEFGFEYIGTYRQRDSVYLKKMHPEITDTISPIEYSIKYYPHYLDGPGVKKFIVPIRPSYHESLFSDTSDIGDSLFKDDPQMYSSQANCIKKAYLCKSNTKRLEKGDLLFFYRTRDRRSIQCVGIVEETYRGVDLEKISAMTAKRTVFTKDELKNYSSGNTLVILFRFLSSVSPISCEMLEKSGVKGPIQSIRMISEDQYYKCFKDA